MSYVKADFDQPDTYEATRNRSSATTRSAVFYLAVAARFFGPIVDHLGQSGLLKQGENGEGSGAWSSKNPSAATCKSAQELNARILKQGDESQFYRIDHFLGKETIQSIMAVRFANGDVRADVAARIHRPRADHGGRDHRRRAARRVLRTDRLPARHGVRTIFSNCCA